MNKHNIIHLSNNTSYDTQTGYTYQNVSGNTLDHDSQCHILDVVLPEWFEQLEQSEIIQIANSLPYTEAIKNDILIDAIRINYGGAYPIETITDVFYFIDWLIHKQNLIFNPDTPFEDYIIAGTDRPVWDSEQCEMLTRRLERCYKVINRQRDGKTNDLDGEAMYLIPQIIDGTYKLMEDKAQSLFTNLLKY